MNKIVDFDSKKEFHTYIGSKICSCLGSGSEGTCFRGKNGIAYKLLSFEDGDSSEYIPEKIITTSDIKLGSFALPDILFTVNGTFVGYTSDLVSPNLFGDEFLVKNNTIDHIDFDKLIEAYRVIIQDVKLITEKGIRIYDLPFNLLYDGEKLVACDTCSYSYDSSITFDKNREALDIAMQRAFFFFILNNDERYKDKDTGMEELLKVNNSGNIEEFLRDLEAKYKAKGSPKVYVKKSSND